MPFRYLRDPVFLACLAIFLVNKLALKPLTSNAFVHGSVNDIICIPLWVPIMLWAMSKTGLRRHDEPPQAHEILIPLLLWSWLFENVLPTTALMRGVTTADPFDVLSYTCGAAMAAIAWKRIYREHSSSASPNTGPASESSALDGERDLSA